MPSSLLCCLGVHLVFKMMPPGKFQRCDLSSQQVARPWAEEQEGLGQGCVWCVRCPQRVKTPPEDKSHRPRATPSGQRTPLAKTSCGALSGPGKLHKRNPNTCECSETGVGLGHVPKAFIQKISPFCGRQVRGFPDCAKQLGFITWLPPPPTATESRSSYLWSAPLNSALRCPGPNGALGPTTRPLLKTLAGSPGAAGGEPRGGVRQVRSSRNTDCPRDARASRPRSGKRQQCRTKPATPPSPREAARSPHSGQGRRGAGRLHVLGQTTSNWRFSRGRARGPRRVGSDSWGPAGRGAHGGARAPSWLCWPRRARLGPGGAAGPQEGRRGREPRGTPVFLREGRRGPRRGRGLGRFSRLKQGAVGRGGQLSRVLTPALGPSL